ncbi:activating signal cointegrator 1 complex subunit 1 [Denticeps clupeoides]|uniref:K Homology domain-containing protein n=1 Tax=Denticeps clupeoides TaxID=299321 RepID=A0AAY3ZTE5_9TELE|nr:activating signal cointegrator 1 complex subunit 1 [Denticeps clupeoides]XP_028826699.1 activating signal cointegrator 1 complex subunit 1 [Denticeps clupeoides]XP_028826700.1 activating signal cointegrator 1 complex subunit 1 [Denticeps clupeoides]XP_028826701.1 activating signal cointegrator 1 complex subunit 1 [Denticeps clupeoides]
MEVLRPALININGRVYRKNPVKEEHHDGEEDEDISYSGPADLQGAEEPCDVHPIEQTEKGFRCAVDVPSVLYKYIIGKKGETRKRLESETKTSISIPKQGVEGEIVITGAQRATVASAVTRIEVLIESVRRKQPFTHFLSFPLNHPQIQDGFLRFKEEVLEKCSQERGIDASIFQNAAKLHLTVGTLALLNAAEVALASELLQQCQGFIRDITGGKPLPLTLAGVEYMNDDPSMVDILYAKVEVKDGSDKLQAIADRLVEHFVASGLMIREWDRVKLHGTIMNTLFRKDPSAEDKGGSGKPNSKDREAFDARNVLQEFSEYHFGEFEMNCVQLSQRYSTEPSGYYTSACQVTFS